MKTILRTMLFLSLSISTLAAIPHNGDDERSINDPSKLQAQNRIIKDITKKMNLVLMNYTKVRQLDSQLSLELNELANEVHYINEVARPIDGQYLQMLSEDIKIYQEEIQFLINE